MAETVKKSRIVSDTEENLEEALMEEFNMRLKSCMSQDNLQNSDEDVETQNSAYENVEAIKVSNEISNISKPAKTTNDFIQVERENYYEEPIQLKNGHQNQNNHVKVEDKNVKSIENIYENVIHQTKTEEQKPIEDHYLEMHSVEVVKSPIVPTLEYEMMESNVVDSSGDYNGTKELYEVIQKPALNLPTTSLTLVCDTDSKETDQEAKSVKDRMFLATDDTSCLLFTQTVTSPMLTPSEENIDFLKGFRRESTQNTSSDNTNSSPKSEKGEEEKIIETLDEMHSNSNEDVITDLDDIDADFKKNLNGVAPSEHIYETLNDVNEHIYDNISSIKINGNIKKENNELIYENLKDNKNSQNGDILNLKLDDEDESHEIVEERIYQNLEELKNNVDLVDEHLDLTECGIENLENIENLEETDEIIKIDELNCAEEVIDSKVLEEVENVELPAEEIQLNTESKEVELIGLKEEKLVEEILPNNVIPKAIFDEPKKMSKISDNIFKAKENGDYEVTEHKDTNREKDTETVPAQIVQNLKTQFLKSSTAQVVATTKKEIEQVSELKTINIMKQITKFEHNEEFDELNSTTEVHESSYVETSTFETKSTGQDKALKKKKSKKSRKEEKENISVSGTSNGESFYNVNVKILCRSFGDLTKLGDENSLTINRRLLNTNIDRPRTKSLSDVALNSSNKIENVFSGVSVRTLRDKFSTVVGDKKFKRSYSADVDLKSSFNKFDALQKKNVLHVRSSDSTKAQEKFNGSAQIDNSNCKSCGKVVFQMEQMKAEKNIWHKNCFRCQECNKQLNVDTYQSHEGTLYCKPHFKALFAPKAVEDEEPPRSRKPELIIRENQPMELPPDVVRASDKPDLGLEELQTLNVKERFQVFEQYQNESNESERATSAVNVKRSPSILSKLARFQAKGMDVGVSDDTLNGIPIEESSSEDEQTEVVEGEDADLIRAKRVQKEKPFHFTGMNDVKNKWEHGESNTKNERREEYKQEIQSIRNKLFMGKQGKMKEAYQQAVLESETGANVKKETSIESSDTKSLKERFEKGEILNEKDGKDRDDEEEVYESEISKKSRSLFLELDANAAKAPQISPATPPKVDIRKAKEAYLNRVSSEDVVKSSEIIDDVVAETADIQQRFKFFETYKEPEKNRKQFRITPPREGQVKAPTPEREIYRDPDVVRAEEFIEDSVVAKESHTATKMLNKFRQLEESNTKEPIMQGPKPLKRFTPPPEPARPQESSSEGESGSEEESEGVEEVDHSKLHDIDLVEAQKAARAKQLRAKFERWEANEIKREQNNSSINIAEELGEDQSQIESTKILRARFESMRHETSTEKTPRVKVNRFVKIPSIDETCKRCNYKVYPLEKISVHGYIYHKKCFKCMECKAVLRMDSYSYNQGQLYCTTHFKRLFISKGNYDTAFGLEQHKEKWNTTAA